MWYVYVVCVCVYVHVCIYTCTYVCTCTYVFVIVEALQKFVETPKETVGAHSNRKNINDGKSRMSTIIFPLASILLLMFALTQYSQARIMLRAGNIEAVHLLLSGPFGTEHSVTDPSATIQEVRVLQAALRSVS